jgi:hypothetical protein
LNDFQLLRCGEDYYLLNQRHDGTYEMFDKLDQMSVEAIAG